MKAPPALISLVVPLMSVRWVLAKTGNVRLALGCCRLSVTLAVRKIIPSSMQSHSLDLVVGQVILPSTQQEGCYRGDSNPLVLYLIERRNLSLQSRVQQRLCQFISGRILFHFVVDTVSRYCSLKLASLSHRSHTVVSCLLNRSGGGHQFSLSVVDCGNGSAVFFCDD